MDSEVDGRSPRTGNIAITHVKNCSACPDAKATSFCVDCQEYLCQGCTNYHHRFGALKDHTLLTGEHFPSDDPPICQQVKTESIRKCPDHPNEKIKFYCQGHNALCCVACNVLGHEQCTKMYIPDIAEEFKNGPEFGKLHPDIQNTERMVVASLTDIDNCLKAVGALKDGELEILRKYKAKIIEYLDRREKELQAEVQNLHEKDVALLQELQTQFKTRLSQLNDMKANLISHERNSSELFIAAKRACGQLAEIQCSLQEITAKIGYRQYSLEFDPKMKNILQEENGFAGVEMITGE